MPGGCDLLRRYKSRPSPPLDDLSDSRLESLSSNLHNKSAVVSSQPLPNRWRTRYDVQCLGAGKTPMPFLLQLSPDANEYDAFILAWQQATKLELHQRCRCDLKRRYKGGPPPPLNDLSGSRLQGLSKYLADNNSAWTIQLFAIQSYLNGRIQKCSGTGLSLSCPVGQPMHPMTSPLLTPSTG